jgi:hypothetical protein
MADYSWVDSVVPGIAVPLSVAFVVRWLIRKYPSQSADDSAVDVGPISSYWTILSIVLWLASIAGIAWGVQFTAGGLNQWIAEASGPATFLLIPTPAWRWLYGIACGLGLSCLLVIQILRKLMGDDRFRFWQLDQDKKAGFNSDRALKLMAWLIVPPFTLFFLPSLGCHTRFAENEVGIQTYGDFQESRYRYQDVARIAVVEGFLDRAGNFDKDPRLVIDFRDQRRWSSRDSFRDPHEIDPDLAAFLATKTDLRFQYVATVEELN